MDNIGKQLASVIIVFFGMFTMIFCFDSPDRITNLILVCSIILICGGLLWLLWRKGGKR